MQSLAEMVNPGGTGRPRFAISARPAPLPPRMSRIAAEGPQHAVQREIAERVHAEVIADLCDAVARPDQLVPAGRVDPVIARPGDGRRSDAEMHLGRTRLADQLNQRPAGGA